MEGKWIVRRHERNERKMMCDKNILSNEMFLAAFNFQKTPSFLFYTVDMDIPFHERGNAEVLSVVRNKMINLCCYSGGIYTRDSRTHPIHSISFFVAFYVH
jgi:hypothetical protein